MKQGGRRFGRAVARGGVGPLIQGATQVQWISLQIYLQWSPPLTEFTTLQPCLGLLDFRTPTTRSRALPLLSVLPLIMASEKLDLESAPAAPEPHRRGYKTSLLLVCLLIISFVNSIHPLDALWHSLRGCHGNSQVSSYSL